MLLGQAVKGSKSPDQVQGRQPDHPAFGKQPRQGLHRRRILRIFELGYQHDAICDVKVAVACGQPLAGVVSRARHPQRFDAELAAEPLAASSIGSSSGARIETASW